MKNKAGVFIIIGRSQLLVGHITNGKWNHWSIPKGEQDNSEEIKETAVRELEEETGIVLAQEQLTFIGKQPYERNPNTILYGYVVHGKLDDISKLRCKSKLPNSDIPEIDGYKLIDIKDAGTWLHEAQVKLLEKGKIHI